MLRSRSRLDRMCYDDLLNRFIALENQISHLNEANFIECVLIYVHD